MPLLLKLYEVFPLHTDWKLSLKTTKGPQYVHTMEDYSMLKGNELSSHEKTWRKLAYNLLSERKQSENAACCRIPTTAWLSGEDKTIEIVKRAVVSGD